MLDAPALGRIIGLNVVAIDILRHGTHDLLDDLIWADILKAFDSGYFSAVHFAIELPPWGAIQ